MAAESWPVKRRFGGPRGCSSFRCSCRCYRCRAASYSAAHRVHVEAGSPAGLNVPRGTTTVLRTGQKSEATAAGSTAHIDATHADAGLVVLAVVPEELVELVELEELVELVEPLELVEPP